VTLLGDRRAFTAPSQGPRGWRQAPASTLNLMNDQCAKPAPVLDIAIPVYNEERALEQSVRALHAHVRARIPFSTRLTIVDNASADGTRLIGMRLATELENVRFMHLAEKGRGRAVRSAWMSSDARVLAYMDVDLSTSLDSLGVLIAPLLSGSSDISIGSRLAPGARVRRSAEREVISRAYNLLLRSVLHTRFRDAQCGFKAIRAQIARHLLPAVRDQGWFFDTELLVIAQRDGFRIHEVPVKWVEDPDSRVNIPRTVLTDLRGVLRMRRQAQFARSGVRAHAVQPQEVR
jgi:glycosyltransferase involved in cell wall biosynthesis